MGGPPAPGPPGPRKRLLGGASSVSAKSRRRPRPPTSTPWRLRSAEAAVSASRYSQKPKPLGLPVLWSKTRLHGGVVCVSCVPRSGQARGASESERTNRNETTGPTELKTCRGHQSQLEARRESSEASCAPRRTAPRCSRRGGCRLDEEEGEEVSDSLSGCAGELRSCGRTEHDLGPSLWLAVRGWCAKHAASS